LRIAESRRHDPDHHRRYAPKPDASSQNRATSAEGPLPEIVSDYDSQSSAHDLLLVGEGPADHRLGTHDPEKVFRNRSSEGSLRNIATGNDRRGRAICANHREGMVGVPPIEEVLERHLNRVSMVVDFSQPREAVGFSKRQGIEQYGLDHAEQR